MTIDTQTIRAEFPALAGGAAFFDGPGGTQTPRPVIDAVAETLAGPISNRGPATAASRRAEEVVLGARAAVADLTGAAPECVVFGRSMTAVTYDLARTLAKDWGPGDEVVVSRLDHDGNIRPWVDAAQAVGATVRWAEFDPQTGVLDVQAVIDVLSDRTRVVAFTAASNILGSKPDVAAITRAVRAAGALSYVDGVHYTPHSLVDLDGLGADLYACSAYKFCGPHLGLAVGRPEVLSGLAPDKLRPSPNVVPERFELGTLPYELLAGTSAAVDFLAGLGGSQAGDRRARLAASMGALEELETDLRAQAERGLSEIEGLTFCGRAQHRTPTVFFSVDGVESADIAAHLADRDVYAPAGSFYAIEAAEALGLGEAGAVRAGMAPYTSRQDVERLVDGVREAVRLLRR